MAFEKKGSLSRLWSYAAFLVVGLVVAYAFLGVQFSGQLSKKDVELGSLRQQYTGLQGELDQARASQPPSQQVLSSCSSQEKQIIDLKKQVELTQASLAACEQKASAGAAASASPIASPTFAPSSSDFVGKTISLAKGQSFSALAGAIALSYSGTTTSGLASFTLNGLQYARGVGSFVYFSTADGSKYVLNVASASADTGAFIFYNG